MVLRVGFSFGLFLIFANHAVAAVEEVRIDEFRVSVDCRSRCVGEEQALEQRREVVFSPVARGLKKGNGQMWGLLGWDLWDWGQQICLDRATRRCSPEKFEVSAVAEFALQKMASGDWELAEPVDCRDRNTHLVSPYDSRKRLTLVPATFKQPIFLAPSPTATAEPATANCKQATEVKLCFGDCMVPSSGDTYVEGDLGMQTLASTKFMTKKTVSFCLDPFLAEYRGKGLSKSVVQYYCERFLWAGTLKQFSAYSSCAATRIATECASLGD